MNASLGFRSLIGAILLCGGLLVLGMIIFGDYRSPTSHLVFNAVRAGLMALVGFWLLRSDWKKSQGKGESRSYPTCVGYSLTGAERHACTNRE